MMLKRDAPHDREPQAAARDIGAHAMRTFADAIKTVEYARAFFERDAGPAIADLHDRMSVLHKHADIDAPTARRVFRRVVDEVVEQHAQRFGVAAHVRRFIALDAEIDAALFGKR